MRYLTLLFFFSLNLTLLAGNEIRIQHNFPSRIEAGKSYQIVVNIEKDGLLTYAGYTQKFPKGWKLQIDKNQVNSNTFSYKNNVLKYQWVRLPEGAKISLKFKLIIPQNAKPATYETKAVFSYIVGMNQGWCETLMTAQLVEQGNVLSSESADNQSDIVVEKTSSTAWAAASGDAGFSCKREIVKGEKAGTFKVKLTVNLPKPLSAKIIEQVPANFAVSEIELQGASMSRKNNYLSFFWRKTPQKTFIISYLILADSAENTPVYKGQMIVVSDGKILKAEVKQTGQSPKSIK